ncbi:MAG: hypothetical protein JWQ93_974 [Marmoricola sp.]|nr:hypothetical protein [Marmoricola sp.]
MRPGQPRRVADSRGVRLGKHDGPCLPDNRYLGLSSMTTRTPLPHDMPSR